MRRRVYRISSSNLFRSTEIGSFRGEHDNIIYICSIGSPSRIRRHFCSHSVDRNKLMPIMANHSNPEMDGRRIERYSKTSRRNFDHLLKGERAYYYGKTYLPLSTTFRRPKSAVSAVSKGFSRTVLSRFLIFQRKTPTWQQTRVCFQYTFRVFCWNKW